MADIFISYAREDQERAKALALALGRQGWSVFWDRTVPAGLTWREFIGKELREARSVVVAWSEASVVSDWVLEEAEFAKKRRILIPVFVDVVEAPFGFGSLHGADLAGWDGTPEASAFQQLATDMSRLLGTPPSKGEEANGRSAEEGRKKDHGQKAEEASVLPKSQEEQQLAADPGAGRSAADQRVEKIGPSTVEPLQPVGARPLTESSLRLAKSLVWLHMACALVFAVLSFVLMWRS